jgi:cytochrome c oxidase assembly protein subunit 15
VVLLEHSFAIVHAATAQVFFALTICLAMFTSNEWRGAPAGAPLKDGGRLRRLCLITTGLIYLQVVFGAILRHTGERLDAHLVVALLVALHVILVAIRVSRYHGDRKQLIRPALLLVFFLILQVALGGASYVAKFTTLWPASFDVIVWITTAHLAVGALMLAASVALALRACRLSVPLVDERSSKELLTEQFSV